MKINGRPLILVTNDDSINAKGIKALIEAVIPIGDVVVVAPAEPQSGMSHAITVKNPLLVEKVKEEENLVVYKVEGTPVDCVKLAFNQLLTRKPDILVSGINHGSNSAASIFYSGTMAAAMEGCINNIPSIGFSLLTFDPDADFSASKEYATKIVSKVFLNGLQASVCLNVNIPNLPKEQITGIKVVRQNRGFWKEEFDKRTDNFGRNYYWLEGIFYNAEPEAVDTDEWALKNNFVSIVPVQIDLTNHHLIEKLRGWEFN